MTDQHNPRHVMLIRVGYADTDQMGFAHHSRYLVWMETARTEMLRTTGESYKDWEDRGVLLPLTGAHLEFLKPALYDDLMEVRTRIIESTRLRLSFAYEFSCPARDVLIARGETHHVYMNKEGRPTRVGPETLTRLSCWSGHQKPIEPGTH